MTERDLWQQVVILAIKDAAADPPKRRRKSASSVTTLEQRVAHDWLTNGGRQFRRVCSLAGLDPDFIRDAYRAGRIDVQAIYRSEDRRGVKLDDANG